MALAGAAKVVVSVAVLPAGVVVPVRVIELPELGWVKLMLRVILAPPTKGTAAKVTSPVLAL